MCVSPPPPPTLSLKAGYLIKACMHGWGRQGERKASLKPYFAGEGGGEGEEEGGGGGVYVCVCMWWGDILRSNCHFSHFFSPPIPYFFSSPSPTRSPLFLLQAPAPSNRTERHEVPLRGRSHPSQLGGVAVDRGQSHHQRFQYDRAS